MYRSNSIIFHLFLSLECNVHKKYHSMCKYIIPYSKYENKSHFSLLLSYNSTGQLRYRFMQFRFVSVIMKNRDRYTALCHR